MAAGSPDVDARPRHRTFVLVGAVVAVGCVWFMDHLAAGALAGLLLAYLGRRR